MKVKKFVFFFLFFTHAINLAEEKGSDNKNITVSTIKEDNLINENNWNTRKWGSIFLLFNPLTFWASFFPENLFFVFVCIFPGDVLYRYISKKGVVFMCKFGFYSKFIYYKPKNDNEESLLCFPRLTVSLCGVYKKKGKKIFSGSFAPIGVGERWFTNKSDKSLDNLFFLFLSLSFLHYENGKGFFLSW